MRLSVHRPRPCLPRGLGTYLLASSLLAYVVAADSVAAEAVRGLVVLALSSVTGG